MVLLFAMAMGGNVGILTMLPLFLIYEHGFNLTKANTFIGFSQVAGMLMVFVAGWITDRVGEKLAMAVVLLTAGIATILIGCSEEGQKVVSVDSWSLDSTEFKRQYLEYRYQPRRGKQFPAVNDFVDYVILKQLLLQSGYEKGWDESEAFLKQKAYHQLLIRHQ